jgi:hypothetical protein
LIRFLFCVRVFIFPRLFQRTPDMGPGKVVWDACVSIF